MMEEVKDIMLEHLKLLKESADDCDYKYLQPITQSMVITAQCIKELAKSENSP
ncbi:MAG: hypothetical protein ACI4JJ_03820 [Huintestinicola sp.]